MSRSDPPRVIDRLVDRAAYRRRRMADAARLLPVVGAILFTLPLLWQTGGAQVRTSMVMLFILGVWLGLVVLGAVLSAYLAAQPGTDEGEG